MGRTRSDRRRDRGAVALGGIITVVGLVAVGGGGGFAVQRIAADDGAGGSSGEVAVGGAAPVVPCPGDPALTELHGGDRVFAVAVHAELDDWLLIRDPEDPADRWWIEARHVTTDGPVDELARVTCDGTVVEDLGGEELAASEETTTTTEDTTTTTTSEVDESTTTTATAGPTPAPAPGPFPPPAPGQPPSPPPAPKPTTTTTPDTSGPSLSVSSSREEIWETSPGLCTGRPKSSTITASANDPSGVASVRATWSVGNHNENKSMGPGPNHSTTFGPYGHPTVPQNGQQTVIVTVTATDAHGNETTRTTSIVLHSASTCFG